MTLLRATVRTSPDWLEMKLLDIRIVADGPTEEAVLEELEYRLVAEYELALHYGETPFMNLIDPNCPEEVSRAWEDDGKKFRSLDLPNEVRAALAAAFKQPKLSTYQVLGVEADEAA